MFWKFRITLRFALVYFKINKVGNDLWRGIKCIGEYRKWKSRRYDFICVNVLDLKNFSLLFEPLFDCFIAKRPALCMHNLLCETCFMLLNYSILYLFSFEIFKDSIGILLVAQYIALRHDRNVYSVLLYLYTVSFML